MQNRYLKVLSIFGVLLFLVVFMLGGCIPKGLRESLATADQGGPSEQTQAVDTTAQAAIETQETAPAYQLSAKDLVILAMPAVCSITSYYSALVYDPQQNDYFGPYYSYIYYGTGFCINPSTGHILTAAHVVDISEVEIKNTILDEHIFQQYPDYYYDLTDEDWTWIYENYDVVGETSDTKLDHEVLVQFNQAVSGLATSINTPYTRAEIVDFSPWEQRDIAILKVQSTSGGALSSVMLGESGMMETLDQCTIIGYPWTSEVGQDNLLNPTITTGNISGKVMLGGTEVLQVQGDARPGNSGGPVLDSNGKVIGMLTMGTDETNNYLRPAADMREMLNRNGVQNVLGIVDEEFKQGLINYRMGNYQEAINHFNAVLNLNQRHLSAQEYRAQAQQGATSTTTSQ